MDLACQGIAVVIVNYHCQELICHCLSSLENIGKRNLSFIVVDNSNISDTDELHLQFPEVVILRSGSNLGFAGGVNEGIRYALNILQASYILLLNPDTRAEHDFIDPLVSALDANPTLGIVGPRICRDVRGQPNWSAGGKLNWWIGRPAGVTDDRFSDRGDVVPVPFLSGCAMLIRATAIKQVGLMDDRLFLYFEDADYVQRYLRAGWGVAYIPDAELFHSPSSTTGFQSRDYVYYFSRNRIWFMRRWAKWYHYVVFMIFVTMIKLPGAIIVFGLVRRQPHLMKAFFRGYLDGLKGSQ